VQQSGPGRPWLGVTIQMHPPDEELWSAAGGGDGAAFGGLFDRYATAVYNHALRLTGSWALAEDLGRYRDHSTRTPAWLARLAQQLVVRQMGTF